MIHDPDGELDDAYYVGEPDDAGEPDESPAEAKDKVKTPKTPAARLDLLRTIASDPRESYSTRADARRLIEVAVISPRDFDSKFAEFNSWRTS